MTNKRASWSLVIGVILCLTVSLLPVQSAQAQPEEERPPIDMMIVIDNSCSMFPRGIVGIQCKWCCSDPDFLRIIGADLFLARLGFDEVNEAEYQAGVISLGAEPKLVSPLRPLSEMRDAIARIIANPEMELATGIVPALELAYRELDESPHRRPTNLPAVVLITDGVPWPSEGQSNAEIKELVSENPDIPLFIMLLQNPTEPSGEEDDKRKYEDYITFWLQMASRCSHVFAYRIESAEEIEDTYNVVVAQLQNTVPSEGFLVTPGVPAQVFVGKCVQGLVVTIIHDPDRPKGEVTVTDPQGDQVVEAQAGVSRFRGEDNPVEVISIASPRLRDELKEDIWTIESDAPVSVFLDRRGCYRVSFVEPSVSLTDITNVYLATERQSPSRELVIRFNLLDKTGAAVVEPQPIQGQGIHPDGNEVNLRIPADLTPDSEGVYEISYDFAGEYPDILDQPGRVAFIINAGSHDERAEERIPIATARLLVDVGRCAYIADVSPSLLICASGTPANLKVTVGDYDICVPSTVRVRVFGSDGDVMCSPDEPGAFSCDVSTLCAPLLGGLACSTQDSTTLRVRLTAQTIGGLPCTSDRDVPVQLVAPTCTPTSTPTDTPTSTPTNTPEPPTPTPTNTPEPPTPTPTNTPTSTPTNTPMPPTPTPCPDSDGDGFDDCGEDSCPTTKGLAQFDGCPPPLWLLVVGGLLGLALLAFIVFWLIPYILILITPPPKGYVLACRKGKRRATPRSVFQAGKSRRRSRVTIGGDRKKAHIYVQGLKPIEFRVERDKARNQVVLVDAESGSRKGILADLPSAISTSNPDVILKISLDSSKLRC